MKQGVLILFCFVFGLLPCRGGGGDTVVLDLSSVIGEYEQNTEGYWKNTYMSNTHVECDIFRFSHTGEGDAGGGMNYWDGFTICTNGDTVNYGAESSSDGWLGHQFGCMAGGGLNNNNEVEKGSPYMVGYWGFFQEKDDTTYHSLRIDFSDGQLYKTVGVYICNHPWPYYGNINGDGFASGFAKEDDYFTLTAHGLDENGCSNGKTVTIDLARFTNGQLYQSKTWQYVDLTSLGNITGLYFTMNTSDEDKQFGPNTAVYFCLDKLTVCSIDTATQDTTHFPGTTDIINVNRQEKITRIYTLFGQPINKQVSSLKGCYIIQNETETKKYIIL